jgi:iron complex transport system substrate-binding protein
MAPNTTEILYALELGKEVVGVSSYTTYPPEAKEKPLVGGTYDPNFEMVVALQPDLVIGLNTQKDIEAQLNQLDIPFLGVEHEHIREILLSILTIGKACNAETKAQQLFQSLEKQLTEFSRVWKAPKPKVLVCVGHDESLSRMYVAAQGTFYAELINLAGGVNACTETSQKYPEISPEGLAVMDPDVVIDILPNIGNFSSEHWKPYRAVAMTNSYSFIPGPRFVLLLEDFTKAIHE